MENTAVMILEMGKRGKTGLSTHLGAHTSTMNLSNAESKIEGKSSVIVYQKIYERLL